MNVGFPDANNRPSKRRELRVMFAIPSDVPANLRDPISGVVTTSQFLKPSSQIASVPKVTVHKDNDLEATKHDVWISGQVVSTQAIAQPKTPESSAQTHLTGRVTLLARGSRSTRRARRSGEAASKGRRAGC